jgi:hypothetical protein
MNRYEQIFYAISLILSTYLLYQQQYTYGVAILTALLGYVSGSNKKDIAMKLSKMMMSRRKL